MKTNGIQSSSNLCYWLSVDVFIKSFYFLKETIWGYCSSWGFLNIPFTLFIQSAAASMLQRKSGRQCILMRKCSRNYCRLARKKVLMVLAELVLIISDTSESRAKEILVFHFKLLRSLDKKIHQFTSDGTTVITIWTAVNKSFISSFKIW